MDTDIVFIHLQDTDTGKYEWRNIISRKSKNNC